MANNTITYTPNYNLAMVAADQDETTFINFRTAIAGTNDSNMIKLDTALADINSRVDGKRYGVSGVGGSSATTGITRLWHSVGLTANVGTDVADANYTNDFDDIAPFNRKRCVGDWLTVNNKPVFRVNAYDGEPGFATDGSAGAYVAVEVEPLWYYQHKEANNTYTLGVSASQIPGWEPHPVCLNKDGSIRQKTYLPCYALSTYDSKGASVSGLPNEWGSYKSLWDKVKTYSTYATLEPIHVRHYEWLLFTIEFATTDCQNIMYGAATMPYSADAITALTATTAVATAAIGNKFVVNQTVYIGATYSAASFGTHTITSIENCLQDGTIDVSGAYRLITVAPFDVSTDITAIDMPTISSRPWITGSCNSVTTPSGSPVSNGNGKYPMRYRYRENIWGNIYSTCGDLMNKLVGDGNETPYKLEWYYLPDLASYYPSSTSKPDATDLAGNEWVKLSIETEDYVNGYIKTMGFDTQYPHAMAPIEQTGGGSSTYYCDYAYLVYSPVVRAVRFGGLVNAGATAGLLYFLAYNAPSGSNWFCGGLFIDCQ